MTLEEKEYLAYEGSNDIPQAIQNNLHVEYFNNPMSIDKGALKVNYINLGIDIGVGGGSIHKKGHVIQNSYSKNSVITNSKPIKLII